MFNIYTNTISITPIVPIIVDKFDEFEKLLRSLLGRTNFIEIWLDRTKNKALFFKKFKVLRSEISRSHPDLKFLAVCKTKHENGLFIGNSQERVSILEQFLEKGGDFVDLDITQNSTSDIKTIPTQNLWLSYHDFSTKSFNKDKLEDIFKQMEVCKPSLYKFAITVDQEDDLKNFIKFAENFPQNISHIFTTMGKYGSIGRQIITQKKLSDYGFYASSKSTKTASGQPVLP